MKKVICLTIICALAAVSMAADNSSYVDVDTSKYSARDITIQDTPYYGGAHGGFTADNGKLHYWSPQEGYAVTDIATGAKTLIGLPAGGVRSNTYGDAFGCYDPASGIFYAATIDGMSDAYIYQYDTVSGGWQTGYTSAINAFGADTYNSQLYFSGLNEPWSGGFNQDTYISRFVENTPHTYGTTGLGLHDSLVRTVGNSASVTVDNQGNVYYASYAASALYKWSAAQIVSVTDDILNNEADEFLTIADATLLLDIPGTGYGITADDAGNIFMSVNNFEGGPQVLMWNEELGSSYEVIATLDPSQYFGFFGDLSIDGDFLAGDSLYGQFGWQNPITEITYVPEPATIAILGLGGLLLRRRRKTN